jgi:hypothetical protein
MIFVKHGVSRPLRSRKGMVIRFIDLGDDVGYIDLDPSKDSQLIAELTAVAGSLGVKISDAAEVEELKKNGNVVKLRIDSMKPQLRVDAMRAKPKPAAPVAEADADLPELNDSTPKPPRKKRVKPLPTDDLAPQPQSAAPVEPPVE